MPSARVREPIAGPAEPREDLVDDEERPRGTRRALHLAQPSGRRHPQAAAPLDHLDHDGTHAFERADLVAERREPDVRRELPRERRAERIRPVGRHRERAMGQPVVPTREGDDAVATGREPRRLERCFDGIRARAAEDSCGEARPRGEHLEERDAGCIRERVAHRVGERRHLRLPRRHDPRVRVPDAHHAEAGRHVDEHVPVRVLDVRAERARPDDRIVVLGRETLGAPRAPRRDGRTLVSREAIEECLRPGTGDGAVGGGKQPTEHGAPLLVRAPASQQPGPRVPG